MHMVVPNNYINVLCKLNLSEASFDLSYLLIQFFFSPTPKYLQELTMFENIVKNNLFGKCDVSSLYNMTRDLSLIQPPTNGWGRIFWKTSSPSLGDDVELIRVMRNYFSHSRIRPIPDGEFRECWTEFQGICRRMDYRYGTLFTNKLKEMETSRIVVTGVSND